MRRYLTVGVLLGAAVLLGGLASKQIRVKAAWAALRGRTVVYGARFENGTLTLDGQQRGSIVANSQFLNTPGDGIRVQR